MAAMTGAAKETWCHVCDKALLICTSSQQPIYAVFATLSLFIQMLRGLNSDMLCAADALCSRSSGLTMQVCKAVAPGGRSVAAESVLTSTGTLPAAFMFLDVSHGVMP